MTKQPILQKMDMLDYLLGKKESKRFPQLSLLGQGLRALTTYTREEDSDSLKIYALNKTDPDYEIMESLKNLLFSDKIFNSFYKAFFKYYTQKNSFNYILSKPLCRALAETKTDILCSHIPKNFSGYLEMPNLIDSDGEEILGIFFNTNNYKDDQSQITLGYLCHCKIQKQPITSMVNTHYKDTELLKDVLKKHVYTEIGVNGKHAERPGELTKHIAAIVNALIYIKNTNDVLTSEINQFSGSKKAIQRQKNIYTELPYLYVGRGFYLPKTFTTEHVVSGHFKWQRHGVGLSLIKHIYVEPYLRCRDS